MLAGWRKRDLHGQRGGREVLPDGRVRLGGDALRHVAALRRHRQHARSPTSAPLVRAGRQPRRSSPSASCSSSSASPSRSRRCRSTPGRPTPTRARPRRSPRSSSVRVEGRRLRRPPRSSCCIAFAGRDDVVEPLMWVLAAAVDDRRQPHRPAPDEHRPHARLLGRRPGRLHAGAARGRGHATPSAPVEAVVTYLLIYAAMNLGAFAVVHRRRPQDPQRRDRAPGAACSSTPRASPC